MTYRVLQSIVEEKSVLERKYFQYRNMIQVYYIVLYYVLYIIYYIVLSK